MCDWPTAVNCDSIGVSSDVSSGSLPASRPPITTMKPTTPAPPPPPPFELGTVPDYQGGLSGIVE